MFNKKGKLLQCLEKDIDTSEVVKILNYHESKDEEN